MPVLFGMLLMGLSAIFVIWVLMQLAEVVARWLSG
jgi:hypothetical protein